MSCWDLLSLLKYLGLAAKKPSPGRVCEKMLFRISQNPQENASARVLVL